MLPAALRTHPSHNSLRTEHRRSILCGFPSRVAHRCIGTPRNIDTRATGTEETAVPRMDAESSNPRALHTGALLVPLLAPRSFPEEEENAQSPEIARAIPRSHGHRNNRKRRKNHSERADRKST